LGSYDKTAGSFVVIAFSQFIDPIFYGFVRYPGLRDD
jgi:hypothetical protein